MSPVRGENFFSLFLGVFLIFSISYFDTETAQTAKIQKQARRM